MDDSMRAMVFILGMDLQEPQHHRGILHANISPHLADNTHPKSPDAFHGPRVLKSTVSFGRQ